MHFLHEIDEENPESCFDFHNPHLLRSMVLMSDSPTAFIDIRARLALALGKAAQAISSPESEQDLSIQLSGTKFAITPCQDPRFGDYQSSAAMAIGKTQKRQPREVAQILIEALDVRSICSQVDIAGAGFINFHLNPEFITNQLEAMMSEPHLGILKVQNHARVVIDYSSPNIAKSMHVGHIRSTFLGDALSRICRAAGCDVITVNHLGDWGTQFGKLIYGYKQFLNKETLASSPISEFERLYKTANTLSEKDENVLKEVRQELAKLQSGNLENLRIWKEISTQSLKEFHQTYDRLGVKFDHELGESFYNPELGKVVGELKRLGIARESEGAICVFFEEDPALAKAAPMIIQKSDGSFLYATTDLAAFHYRTSEWKADEILYVTDARQQLHFKQLKAATTKWFDAIGKKGPTLHHIVFGSILGGDKKPIKTRSGDPIKLKDLLDEAEARAMKIVTEKNPDLPEFEKQAAARVIGLGALKYADLCQNRDLDYTFDWDKLLALQGNTAPYLIYAYVRIQSIFRKDGSQIAAGCQIRLDAAEEVTLGKHLIQFGDTVHAILKEYRPHLLTNYLYDLAVKFSRFYENCPVLKADEPARSSRLLLSQLTARTLKKGLDLLGIETLEKM